MSAIYKCNHENNVPPLPVITAMALWQLIHLGTWCMVCDDNRDGKLFSWLHIYIYIYIYIIDIYWYKSTYFNTNQINQINHLSIYLSIYLYLYLYLYIYITYISIYIYIYIYMGMSKCQRSFLINVVQKKGRNLF